MDYSGFGKIYAYPTNRPLTEQEENSRLDPKQRIACEPNDYLSTIKINSTYLELVDRWYPIKGFWTWLSLAALIFVVVFGSFLGWALLFDVSDLDPDEWWVPWVGWLVLLPMFSLLFYGAQRALRTECFRFTHYPMRLNRKTRKVHVFRQDGTTLSTSWDDLFVVVGESNPPALGKTCDLRAHVMVKDGKTVVESFSLGYVFGGKAADIINLWEFIRRYMEDSDGAKQAYDTAGFCLPLHDRKEGLVFGVIRSFGPVLRWPWAGLLAAIPFSLNAFGRWLAMTTSKIPRWPHSVDADCAIDPQDNFSKDWRGNAAYGFFDSIWPMICCLSGWAAIFCVFRYSVQ